MYFSNYYKFLYLFRLNKDVQNEQILKPKENNFENIIRINNLNSM